MLYMLVGLPFSGKSSWAKEQGHPIVSIDSVRHTVHNSKFSATHEDLVWYLAKSMVAALLHVGHKAVILDATNTTSRSRRGWTHLFPTTFVVFRTPLKECIAKAVAAGRGDMVQSIERLYDEFDHPQTNWVDGSTFSLRGLNGISNDEIPESDKSCTLLQGSTSVLCSVPVSGEADERPTD